MPIKPIKAVLQLVLATAGFSMAHTASAAPFVLAYTDGQTSQSYTSLQNNYANLSAVALSSTYSNTSTGAIDQAGMTTTTQNIIAFAKSKGIPLYATVSDWSDSYGGFNPAISHSIVSNSTVKNTAINNLVALAKNNGFAGIALDWEAVKPADKSSFSAFVTALASSLHANSFKLIISLPIKRSDTDPSYLGGFDYAALGAAADYAQIMTYDEVGPGWSSSTSNGNTWPGPNSGLDWQKAVLSYTASRIPASKVLSGLPAYGTNYYTGQQVHWDAYASTIANYGATIAQDAVSSTPYAAWGAVKSMADGTAWSSSTRQPVLWFDDVPSIKAKASLVGLYGLGGTSVWAMGYEDANFWSAIQSGLGSSSLTKITLTGVAGSGGSVTPPGDVAVTEGSNQTFTITPSSGYTISSVTADGVGVGNVSSYTFYNVQAPHNLTVSFIATPNQVDGQIGTSGIGYVWAKNTSALTNTNRSASKGINDGNLTTGVTINPAGEGSTGKWEAAGIIWSSPKTIGKVSFINGALDNYGNGYLQSNVTLQFTTNGTTWFESGWTLTPPYPNSPAASGASYAFSGASISGILGARVSGKTGSNSWSWIVKEVQVTGH